MKTYIELYNMLQMHEEDDIFHWIEDPWIGKDKQECILRICGQLGLIDKLTLFYICNGNYNKKTITKNTMIRDIFYNKKGNPTNLKDKGDSSDLTGISKNNDKHLLVTTSKNLNKTQIGKLDIDKILTNFQQYKDEGYTMTLCICVRDLKDFETMKNNVEKTNHQLKILLEKEDTIIIDWNDLNQAYHQFKKFYGKTPIDDIIHSNKSTLCLKMHQMLGVTKTLKLKNSKNKKILWGHIQRSGKSYIIGGCIIDDSKDKDECNYLVITTAPNETIEQQRKVFDCIQLQDFNIIVLNGKNKKPNLTKKNIIICSKQFLQTKIDKGHDKNKHSVEKTESIAWLKKMSFEMRFIDESHNGGTTELAKKTLEFYGKQAFTVQITATYSKPINDYNIPKDCWILWDLEDIKLCKNITEEGSRNRLVEKHGNCIEEIISQYSEDNIINEYSKYPELWLLTDELSNETIVKLMNRNKIEGHEYDGYSMEGCFLLYEQKYINNKKTKNEEKDPSFQSPDKVLDIFYRIFGKIIKDEFGDIYDEKYPRKNIFIERIKNICNNPENKSRFIGEGDFHNEPMIIMAFLPQNNIDNISKATIKLLEKNNVIPDYEIISINSKTTDNPKQSIEDARIKARNSGKKGVLVLSGKQCSLGVSINNCDIVLLLNNSMGSDMIYQMMFRCMTEGKNKKCGFVVDLNIHRVIETSVINYASLIKPDIHPREATKFILQERLINLNGDHWMPSFGNDVSKINALCKNIYELYSSKTEKVVNYLLNRLCFKKSFLTNEEQKIFNAIFSNTSITKKQKELIDKYLEEEEKIQKGIEKTLVENKEIDTLSVTNDEDKKEEKEINYMDILKHIIPLICLLTIHNKETSFVEMFKLIENNEYVYNILINQTKSWWGKSVDSKILKKFINIYFKYMKDDKETNQIIRTVKEIFTKNIKNNKELSILIDKYLIPQELEKKSNAEISTPHNLRKEMLKKIPIEFWTSKNKVFEPCSGKGGFIVDIIDRFMIGLKKTIPDEKERYKTIVEQCLYFSDINPTNIFICKLLIDPYNEYKLNYNEGNTLEINIKEKWDINEFDAVIGNPPYSTDPSKQNTTPLYNLFTEKYIDKCKYLLYVIPSRWFIGGKGLDNFRKKMKGRKDIKLICHQDNEKKWFGNNVEIKGGVNYFLKDSEYNGDCLFNGIMYDLSKYDMIINPKHHSIIDKIINHESLDILYKSSGYFKVRTNDKRLKDEGELKCYVSYLKSKNRYKFIDNYDNKNNSWKVITSRAAFGAYSGFGYKNISDPNEIYTDSYISFHVKSYEEASSLLSYMETKYVNYLLSVRKISQDISENTCKWIPLVPLNKKWNNDEVYKYFKITKEEVKIIEDSI